jgi:hypothetical protein
MEDLNISALPLDRSDRQLECARERLWQQARAPFRRVSFVYNIIPQPLSRSGHDCRIAYATGRPQNDGVSVVAASPSWSELTFDDILRPLQAEL